VRTRPAIVVLAVGLVAIAAGCGGTEREEDRTGIVVGAVELGANGAAAPGPAVVAAGSGAGWFGFAGLTPVNFTTLDAQTPLELPAPVSDLAVDDAAVWARLEDGTLTAVDPIRRATIGDPVEVGAGGESGGLAVGSGVVWAGAGTGVVRIDAEDRSRIGDPIDLGAPVAAIVTEGEGAWIAIGADPEDGGRVVNLDAAGEEVADVEVGERASAMAILAGNLWVATDRGVVSVALDSNEVTGDPIDIGAEPESIAAEAGNLWVTAEGPDVTRIDPVERGIIERLAVLEQMGESPDLGDVAARSGQVWVGARSGRRVAVVTTGVTPEEAEAATTTDAE